MTTLRIPLSALTSIGRAGGGTWGWACRLCDVSSFESNRDDAENKTLDHLFEEHGAYTREVGS